MSMGSSPPSTTAGVPAATQVGQAQLPFSSTAQQSSMIGQQGPYGSLQYVQTGTTPQGTPTYTAINQLSPAQQGLLNQYTNTQALLGASAEPMLGWGNYGSVSPSAAIGDIASGLTGQGMTQGLSFLQPFFTTQTSQLDNQLRNQGFIPGEPGYDNAMRQMQTNQGLQVNNLVSSLFPQEQQFAMNEYQLPAQMAQSFASFGAPGSLTTGFTQSLPGMTAPNITPAYSTAQQSAMDAYQAKMAQENAMMAAIAGIPAALGGGWAMGGFKGLPS